MKLLDTPKIKLSSPASSWSIRKTFPQVHRLDLNFTRSGQKQSILLTSDHHWDHPHCDRKLLARDLVEAEARQAPVFVFGDLFDVMQGKYDPRSNKHDMRPELAEGGGYLDECVSQGVDWYNKYAQSLALISEGNHETSIRNRQETCLTTRMVQGLQASNPNVCQGDYWGFVQIQCNTPIKKTDSKLLSYHHGYGGSSEVTRGMIDNNRTRGQYAADIYVSGHVHRRNMDENVITTVDRLGSLVTKTQWFLRCASYKAETRGWHAEKGRAARPLGGWWLEVTYKRSDTDPNFSWSVCPT